MRKLHQMFAKHLNIGNMTSPGRTNLPDFFTSLVPISAKVFRMVLMSAFFNSVELANLTRETSLGHDLCSAHFLGLHHLRFHCLHCSGHFEFKDHEVGNNLSV